MIPTFVFTLWIRGLLSLAILVGAICLGKEWYDRSHVWDPRLQYWKFAPDPGWNTPTAFMAGAILLAVICLAGGPLFKLFLRMTRRSGDDPAKAGESPAEVLKVTRPDGTELAVRIFGNSAKPALVFTHGWGLTSDAWRYAHRELGGDFRMITWDEPGLGGSSRPTNRDYSLEKMAGDLEAVLREADAQPAILVGHSIGGMISLTFCRLFPESLGQRVCGLVLTHTTYTNPVRTTAGAAILSAIETPVLKPLMYLTIALSPLLRLMNFLSYLNGSLHLTNMQSGFAGTESWEQIEFTARLAAKASPAVLARGMLGMMDYDATAVLKTVGVPALVVAGDRDSTCQPEASARMYRDLPHAQAVELSPAKHLGFLEHHLRYAEHVRSFATNVFAQLESPAAKA